MKKRPLYKPRRDVGYLKPVKFQDHFTLAELSAHVQRDPSWIRQLEKDGRIPKAQRIKRGKISIRLWSPEQAAECKRIIDTHHPGRPRSA